MKSQRFGKARRVRRRSEFQQVFNAGSRVQGRFFTLIMAPNQVGTTRLGIVASRKIGDSVSRNRAKRLIREIFRKNIASGTISADLVVIPRRELFDAGYSSLQDDFLAAFRRCTSRLSSHAR
jgi:ribonuclease P protein component